MSWKPQTLKPQFRASSINKFSSDKPLYNSMTPQEFIQAKITHIEDKKLIKEIIKYFSENDNYINNSDIIARLLTFNANIEDIEVENMTMNNDIMKYRQDLMILKGQLKSFSSLIKQKDESILILKGKLYQKDQSLRDLNTKLNKIIQAIQATPNQQCSFSLQDIPKLVIQQQNEDELSLTIPDTPNEFSEKVIELQNQNENLKQRIKTVENQLTEKNKQAATNQELQKMISSLNALTFEKNELELKLHDSIAQAKQLRVNITKIQALQSSISHDEVQQLRSSIRSLQQLCQAKTRQIDSLNIEIIKLKGSDKLYRQRMQQINKVTSIFNDQRSKSQTLLHQNRIQLQRLTAQNISLKTQNSKLIYQSTTLRRDVDMYRKHLSSIQSIRTISSPNSLNNQQLLKKNKQLQNRLQQLKINMQQFEHRHGNEVRALQMKLSKYQSS